MVGEVAVQSVVDIVRLANQFVNKDGRHAIATVHRNIEVVMRTYKLLLESEIIGIDILFLDLTLNGTGDYGLVAFH